MISIYFSATPAYPPASFENGLKCHCVPREMPVSLAIFAFPLPLQVQLSGFAAAFWTLMCLQIGARTNAEKDAVRCCNIDV